MPLPLTVEKHIIEFFKGNRDRHLNDRLHPMLRHHIRNGDVDTEGELEHILWMMIFNWMRQLDEDKYYFDYNPWKIKSQLYNKKFKQYPDLILRYGDIDRVNIELKQYNGKDINEDDLIEDVEKNRARCQVDEQLHSILLFTSTVPEEEANRIVALLHAKVGSEREHIININNAQ